MKEEDSEEITKEWLMNLLVVADPMDISDINILEAA
jgi:hypothetical protein